MKMHVVGIAASEGVGKTSGKAYAIGQLHTLATLAPPRPGSTARGAMGTTYRCSPELIKRIAHLSFPVVCDVTLEPQMMFGKREEVVTDVAPVERAKATA